MARSALWVTAALLMVACEDGIGPEDATPLASPSLVAASATGSFSTDAVLSGNLVTTANPITYTVDFGRRFSSISRVVFLFRFGDDLLDPNDCLLFFPSDASGGGSGVCNPNATAQTSRTLDSPCATHAELGCDPFRDGVSSGELRVEELFLRNVPVSVGLRSLTVTIEGESAAGNSWITQPDLEPGRNYLATAAVTNALGQSVVYAIAGTSHDNTASRTVKAYNVATKRWTWEPPLPLGLYGSNGAGVINGKIYISGGKLTSGRARRDLYMYDRSTRAWTKKTYMPSPGFSGVTGVINGQLYVLTGCSGDGICDPPSPGVAFYRYNPVTDRWTTLGTPNTSHREAMGGVIGGKFYVVGGNHSSRLEVYDPATRRWTTKASMPEERHLAAAAVVGGKLYVIGGVVTTESGTGGGTVATTIAYDPATNTWTEKAPMPSERAPISASRVVVNGQERIEVLGPSISGNHLQYIP